MRYQEPTLLKGVIKILRREGVEVYLVDEYHTSKHCYRCGNIVSTFRDTINSKKEKRDIKPYVTCHGLTKCCNCDTIYNRDTNSSLNILRKFYCTIHQKNLPSYFIKPNETNM